MRKILTLCGALLVSAASAQLAFTNASAVLSNEGHAGACVGVADMDGDGLDDIIQLDMSRHVYVLYQNADHTFVTYDYGQVDGSEQWGWAIADLNNDGHKDICSGVSTTRFLSIASRGVYTLSNLNGPTIFTQCMTMADWNNDGRVDVYACNDVGPNNIWITNASGVPQYDADFMDWSTPACASGPVSASDDMSGNYGSTATDFDNDGDIDLHISHCRQGVNDPDDCRRWDRLFVNDGNGNYEDLAAEYGLENREQVWTTDFGDYDNDGDLDAFQTTHSSTLMLQENDGTGHFTNVTAGSGLEISGFFLQAKMEDMDNDGFLDVLTGSAEHFFKGNGDGTFTEIDNLFPSSKEILSFAFGDLNGDGFQDVYAGYGDGYVDGDANFPDRLWLNTPNGNHWLNVNLEGVQSNKDAVGARVTIEGPWGTMIREVHAGESYGIVNSFTLHFGLGNYTTIPTLTITWPSGQVDTYNDVAVDQVIGAVEGTCLSPSAEITTPTAPIVCGNGDQLTLTANPGFNYEWSTGATTQSIVVTTPGNYVVTIDDGAGCEATTSITVLQSPDETPVVTLVGDETFCEGGSVTLTSSAASGYDWSNGPTTQSIEVTTSGTYNVTIDGVCGAYTSDDVVVTVLDAPDAPTANDVTIPVAGTADLSATGSNINWYNVATGGTSIGSGNTFTTPFLNNNTTTTYYVSAGTVNGGGSWYGGATDRLQTAAPGQYHNNADNYLFFTATEAFTIVSVKVYANNAGNRTVALINRSNGATLATSTINIPAGESRITLDFAVPDAGDYGLRVVGGNPQLWRDGTGSNPAYPYALGTVGSITSSSVAGANATAYYYFFYDWEVESDGILCESTRTPVVVTVGTVGIADANSSDVTVFPNPATENITVNFGTARGAATVELLDVTGRLAKGVSTTQQSPVLTFGVQDLAPGEYMVRVKQNDNTSMHRVVIK
ncbi:MAG: VCBS repeat-containing protein [Flavobacteriales bacterium]|nr:VCBS repeat-containing protein [Flavobacteriales bacterium]